MAQDRKRSFSFNRDLIRFQLYMSESIAFRLLSLSSETTAALVLCLPVWLAYLSYRELDRNHVLVGLFVAL
ncbi:hypothetical protein EON64_09400 [archaeon]|nr:MAG: hypothetical protein EON64_09400 [archaeon]